MLIIHWAGRNEPTIIGNVAFYIDTDLELRAIFNPGNVRRAHLTSVPDVSPDTDVLHVYAASSDWIN